MFVDASLSASALESALLSNIRGGGGSRLFVYSSCSALLILYISDIGRLLHEVVS